MTAAPSSRTTRASAAAACTRSAAPTAAIRSSRTSIDRAGPPVAAIVTTSASVISTSNVLPSTDAARTHRRHRRSSHILLHGAKSAYLQGWPGYLLAGDHQSDTYPGIAVMAQVSV